MIRHASINESFIIIAIAARHADPRNQSGDNRQQATDETDYCKWPF